MKAQILRDSALKADDRESITATGAGQVSAAPKIIDLGTQYKISPVLLAVVEDVVRDLADTDETYRFHIQLSSDSGFAQVNQEHLADIDEDGDFVLPFIPHYRYVRAFFTLGGTTPDLVNKGTQIGVYER